MYSKSKIYKITDVGYNECYYGSTVQPLTKRIGQHRGDYKRYKEGKANFVTSYTLFDKFGLENCKIELVETFECKSKEELHQRESYYIRNNECVNKVIPDRTKKEYNKEYYEENQENIKEKHKEYREDNKENIKEKHKEYYEENKENIKEKIKEYRQENQEKIKEYLKEYYEENKDKIKEYAEQRVNCDICNKEMRKGNLSRHKKLLHK